MDEIESSLKKTKDDLTQSWEHLRAIAKHESFADSIGTEKKMKSVEFLTEAAEKLQVLEIIHRRVINRFRKLCLFMGMNSSQAENQKVNAVHNNYSAYAPMCVCMCMACIELSVCFVLFCRQFAIS